MTENLAAVTGSPWFRLVRGSILDARLVDELAAGSDWVFHLAAAVGSFVIRDRTLESLRTNIHGTENVVSRGGPARRGPGAASTSEIYGKNTKVGLREDDDRIVGSPLKSRWSYAEAKAIDESLIDAYARERGLRAVIIRFFNTVGPRQTGRYGMVIPRFVRQALAGEPLTVFGTGEQIRCFCHVADVVPALVQLIATDRGLRPGGEPRQHRAGHHRGPGQAGHRGDRLSQRDRAHVLPGGLRPGYEDMQRRVPDCTLARELIGFTPTRTLDDIIQLGDRRPDGRPQRRVCGVMTAGRLIMRQDRQVPPVPGHAARAPGGGRPAGRRRGRRGAHAGGSGDDATRARHGHRRRVSGWAGRRAARRQSAGGTDRGTCHRRAARHRRHR